MRYRRMLLLIAAATACLIAFSCAPRVIVKNTESVLTEKMIPVADEEMPSWQDMIKNGKDSEQRAKGAFWAGQYYYNKKDWDNALKYFSYNEKYYTDVEWGYLSVFRAVDIYAGRKETDTAVEKIKLLMEKRLQFPAFKAAVNLQLDEILKTLPAEELDRLYEKHAHKLIDEMILYRQCKAAFAENDFERFFKYAGSFLFQFRDSEYYDEIQKKFSESAKYKPVNGRSIGVIIPLTGKSMGIGAVIRNGLEIALGEYNEGREESKRAGLVYVDEAAANLEELVLKAIERDNVIAFIGPTYSKTVKQILPIMQQYNTVLFSPTAAQPELVENNDLFFRNCGTARGQANAMAKYIIENTRFKKMSTIYSDDNYGKTLNDAFTAKFTALGGTILKQAGFKPDTNDFRQQIVALGGVDAMLLKSKRAEEAQALSAEMEAAGKRIQQKLFDYLNLYQDEEVPLPTPGRNTKDIKPVVSAAILHFSPLGERVKKYMIDDEMTKKLSYTIAKDPRIKVFKQSATDAAMSDIGLEPADLDRELALSVAANVGADMLIWGRIVEAESDTVYANFVPEEYLDANGTTRYTYSFTQDDYFDFTVVINVLSRADEAVVDTITFNYRKIKEPRFNPMEVEALYIPAIDRKMVLIKDQLKFYDFDLPMYASSAMGSPYISAFMESVEGTVYASEFYQDETYAPAQEFLRKYREKYGVNADVIAANSYDAMSIICALVSSNIESRENFKQVLSGVRNYEGVNGAFSFDSTGDSVRDYFIMKLSGGEAKFQKKVKGE
ncbi:MAG: penicillin-binding protein activator [Oligoflexia bacterium]|nr:penicillin-binding protein activator [Oligoflexia bacterium]